MIVRLCVWTASCLLLLATDTLASSGGISGYYGPSKTCMNCHLPMMRKGTIKLTSPVHTGKKYTFSFTCADTTGAGGTLPVAGVDIHASCGTLAPMESGTKIVNGQLVHSQPKATTGNAKTWQFTWTAPAAPTSCGFTVAGLLGDGNKKDTGDVTCLAMKALLVMVAPDAGPPDLPPVKKDSNSKQDGGGGGDGGNDGNSSTNDGSADGKLGSDFAQAGDIGSSSDGEAETDDDGCGCRISARHRAGPAPLLWLLAVGFTLVGGRRRR